MTASTNESLTYPPLIVSPSAAASQEEIRSQLDLRKRLPELFCRALGGAPALARPVTEAWQSLYSAIAEIDGFIDGDRQLQGDDAACLEARVRLNDATARLLLAAHILLDLHEMGLDPATVIAIQREFHQLALRICKGQHLDITCITPDLTRAWEIVTTKSGTCYELATWSGARLATSDEARLALCRQIGIHLGLLLQISDDYWDLWGRDGERSDIGAQKCASLPIAYALSVTQGSEQRHLHGLLQAAATDAQAEQEARQQILASGAALYLTVKSRSHAMQALDLWHRLEPMAGTEQGLGRMLDKLILHPIRD